MTKKSSLKNRVNKLLTLKNKSYKKKFYLLSRLSESKIKHDKRSLEELRCLARTLNKTNGEMPTEKYIFEFLEKNMGNKSLPTIKESYYLRYSSTFKSVKDVILEEISKINYNNPKLNKKLEETLVHAVNNGINIFESSTTNKTPHSMLDDVTPTKEELDAIESETEDDEFSMEDDTPKESGKTLDRISQIFSPVTGKDPRKISKEKLAAMLGYTGSGKYEPSAKTYKLSGWEKMERDIVKRMNPYANTGISVVAKRKWWIIKSIEACLMLEKQANKAFGTPEDVKAKFNVDDQEQMKAVQTISRSRRSSGSSLSDAESRMIMERLHEELTKGSYDLENKLISEQRLLSLLAEASRYRGGTSKQFAADLELMYPLTDQRPDFERVPQLSDEERQKTQDEVEDYFRRKEEETQETFGGEIDPETGEPLYADEELISRINSSKEKEEVIDTQDIIEDIKASNYLNFTAAEAREYLKQLNKDWEKLRELETKTKDRINPEIFSGFKYDNSGNLIDVPDIIPAEELTDEEKKEFKEIIERFGSKDVIKMINDSEREQIYQELVDKAVTVDEFIAFNKKFKLEDSNKPMSWEDIKRASAGEFTGSAGARQYGVKAWIKSVFLNFSPSDKSDIYSFIAERWYERLIQLDLIDDKSFVVKPDKVNPDDPKLDKVIPRKVLDQAQAAGKYSRSQKLIDISNMLELVNKYTSPRYVKRYFDEKRDDNLPQTVREKINRIQTFAESEEEYDALIKRLETEDPDTMAFAIMESMFNDNSGFRFFATALLKEYYNNIVWPNTEVELAQAVKEYFKKNYPSAGIAKSLPSREGASEVLPSEGKDLFNKIIYIVMERTGIKTAGKGVPSVGQSKEEQKNYMRGKADSRGDFVKAVEAYNRKYQQGKNPILSKYGNGPFNQDDLEDLIDDMFSSTEKALKDYKKKYKSQLLSKDFVEFLDDYLGLEPVDMTSKGVKKPGGKSFK